MTDGVSCLCLTYGRPELLEEAIESFKRQEWAGPKELIVVNDHPEQELSCTDDEVVIVNLQRRLRTLGEKRNFSVALARYDYLLVWDDDDIHLPWRIAETMRMLDGAHFFKCPQVWLMIDAKLEGEPRHDSSIYHCAAAYSRYLFKQIGGYRCMNGGEDQEFESRIRLHPLTNRCWHLTPLPIERLYLIYRRKHGHYHASGCMSLREINPTVRKGRYQLRPHWKKDYCNEVKRQIERLHVSHKNT
jgi:glycosyltransferase involved in cell wall biosynthesis